MDNNHKVLLHLSLIYGIGPNLVLKFIKKLFNDFLEKQKNVAIQKMEFDLNQIYNFSLDDFIKKFHFTMNQAKLLFNGLQDKVLLEKEIELINKYHIDIYTFIDDDYPNDLKQIYAPPIVLYGKGLNLGNYNKKLAIVGSRKSTNYASQVLNRLVPDLVKNDITIVSGGAYGVDIAAHKAAIDYGGKTIVILGAGLLQPANKLNRKFLKYISKNDLGTLISPFPLMREADRSTFPARNRIISGMSSGCLIVQAAKKSGALITAQHTLDEGRTVFAIPGDITLEVSAGSNNLIKEGAKIVTNVDDILQDFGINHSEIIRAKINQTTIFEEEIIVNQKNNIKDDRNDFILKSLDREYSIDELSLKLNMSLDELQDKLFDLQLEGHVKQNLAGYWELL